VRGGLDDALERLARRDELRRRAAGQAAGTPPAVTELVEAVAAVVARNPELAITMGVEGAGDPVLLHFALDEGIVQVNADNPLTARDSGTGPTSPRHADFDLDLDLDVEEAEPAETDADRPSDPTGFDASDFRDGADHHDDGTYADDTARPGFAGVDSETIRLRYGSVDSDTTRLSFGGDNGETTRLDVGGTDAGPGRAGYDPRPDPDGDTGYDDTLGYDKKFGRREQSDDGPATYRAPAYEVPEGYEPPPAYGRATDRHDDGFAGRYEPVPSPFAATPLPEVPPQTRASADDPHQPPTARQMPAPMPTPMPLRVEPEETELAAKRLAALLREDPSLLQPNPHD
jgi:hypothetical protein